MDEQQSKSSFIVNISGQIESANFGGETTLYCRYGISYGDDWNIVSGVENGTTQIARRSGFSKQDDIVLNFPIEASFQSSSPFGWPRIAFGVYGFDLFGRDVILGYSSLQVPIGVGTTCSTVQTYAPLSTTVINEWWSWIVGSPPELYDMRFVNQAEGREVVKVKSSGSLVVKLNVSTKGMEAAGFQTRNEDS